jgi:hypothetical protein
VHERISPYLAPRTGTSRVVARHLDFRGPIQYQVVEAFADGKIAKLLSRIGRVLHELQKLIPSFGAMPYEPKSGGCYRLGLAPTEPLVSWPLAQKVVVVFKT